MRRNRSMFLFLVFMIGFDFLRFLMLLYFYCDLLFKKFKDSNLLSFSDENVFLYILRWILILLDKLGVVISENLFE